MKSMTAVFLASLVLGACEKSDNVSQLHAEAVDTAKYYTPQVDQLDKRRQEIFQHGRNVPGNLPDVPEIVRLIGEAGDKINEMKGITSSLPKQADDAAKTNKTDELEKLIDETNEKLEADWIIANEDLTKVEGWLWQYEQNRGQLPPPPPPPAPTPNDTGEPPPAAAGQGSAAQPAGEKKGAGEKKADEKKPAEKAADKAATEKADKKAADKAAPKAADKAAPKAADKAAPKAADKAAAPKAAGSAAKP